MNGTYNLTLQTQMGIQNGTLVMFAAGNKFRGTLELMGMKQEISGTVKGNSFEFSLETRKMLMKIKITFRGIIDGDKLTGEADTNFGKISVSGVRAA